MIRELYRRSVTVLQGRICAGKRLFREIFILVPGSPFTHINDGVLFQLDQ